ncbi:MAG: hypothetical protein KBS95_06685 [Alistipes sp.]|nr:hypothetical protein [Candidatus Alistipes equi]
MTLKKNYLFFSGMVFFIIFLLYILHVIIPLPTKSLSQKITAISSDTLSMEGIAKPVIIKKGETVTLLAVRDESIYRPMQFWVETSNGNRGYVNQFAFDHKAIVLKSQEGKNACEEKDTITLMGCRVDKVGFWTYTAKKKDGTKIEIKSDDICTCLAFEYFLDYELSDSRGTLLSKRRFESRYIGHTFQENERRARQAEVVVNQAGRLRAYERVVLVAKDGALYRPVITYDENSIASSYELRKVRRTRNAWLISYVHPVIEFLLDVPTLANQFNSTMFEIVSPYGHSTVGYWILFVFYIIALLLYGAVWYVVTPLMLPTLFLVLLRWPSILREMSDATVWMVAKYMAILCYIIWAIVMLPFMPWWLLPLFYFPLRWFDNMEDVYMYGAVPHGRCQNSDCRVMWKNKFDRRVFLREYDTRENNSYYTGTHVTSKQKYQTWKEDVTTKTYADGHKTVDTYKHDVQNHTITSGYRSYDDYDELVHYKEYQMIYKCPVCGYEEYYIDKERNVIDRHLKGTHNNSFTRTT